MRQTLDKLGPVKTELIRIDPDWQNWNFERLLKELREYTIRNPEKICEIEQKDRSEKKDYIHKMKGIHVKSKERIERYTVSTVVEKTTGPVIVTK